MKKSLLAGLAVGCMVIGFAGTSHALDFDFAGTFQYDNDVSLLGFNVASDSTITIFSSSWDDGGFDPILSIWNANGSLAYSQDDGHTIGTTMSNGVSYDHGTWDSYYQLFLTAGNYTASISQFDNFPVDGNLSDGFEYDDNQNFTFDLGYGPQPYFNGVAGSSDARTGDWVFHILNVAEAQIIDKEPVPEPATMFLFGTGLVGLAGARARRKKNA